MAAIDDGEKIMSDDMVCVSREDLAALLDGYRTLGAGASRSGLYGASRGVVDAADESYDRLRRAIDDGPASSTAVEREGVPFAATALDLVGAVYEAGIAEGRRLALSQAETGSGRTRR